MTASETPRSETSLLAHSIEKFTGLFEREQTPRNSQSEPDELNLEPSEVFEILRPERRQAIIKVLYEAETTPISVSELAEEVAAIEYDCTPTELDSDQRKRVYIAVYQVHLPRLTEASIVSYSSETERKLVDRGENFGGIHHILSVLLDTLGKQ
jgi:hypothetical protein